MPTDTTGHLRVLNSYDCEMIMEPPILGNSKIDPYSALELINVPVNNTAQISTTIRFNYDSLQCNIKKDSYGPWKGNLILQQHQVRVTFILAKNMFWGFTILNPVRSSWELRSNLSTLQKEPWAPLLPYHIQVKGMEIHYRQTFSFD